MIVRLRGAEQEALDADYGHPFSDVPTWASPYVGYMYYHKLTSGQSAKLYGAYDKITEIQYVTFLLRALGYNDTEGDFYWANSLTKAYEIGLLSSQGGIGSDQFTRGHMVAHTFDCLNVKVKGSSIKLVDQLTSTDALPPTVVTAGIFHDYETYQIRSRPSAYSVLLKSIEKVAFDLMDTYTFDVSSVSGLNLDDLTSDVNTEMPRFQCIHQSLVVMKST